MDAIIYVPDYPLHNRARGRLFYIHRKTKRDSGMASTLWGRDRCKVTLMSRRYLPEFPVNPRRIPKWLVRSTDRKCDQISDALYRQKEKT